MVPCCAAHIVSVSVSVRELELLDLLLAVTMPLKLGPSSWDFLKSRVQVSRILTPFSAPRSPEQQRHLLEIDVPGCERGCRWRGVELSVF